MHVCVCCFCECACVCMWVRERERGKDREGEEEGILEYFRRLADVITEAHQQRSFLCLVCVTFSPH